MAKRKVHPPIYTPHPKKSVAEAFETAKELCDPKRVSPGHIFNHTKDWCHFCCRYWPRLIDLIAQEGQYSRICPDCLLRARAVLEGLEPDTDINPPRGFKGAV